MSRLLTVLVQTWSLNRGNTRLLPEGDKVPMKEGKEMGRSGFVCEDQSKKYLISTETKGNTCSDFPK